ncbi:MAG: hypothetical protein Q8O16_01065, partial [Dehalococcoidia bacterium]|nr:hypothetical protein [Dehalococcoidia bacterium]
PDVSDIVHEYTYRQRHQVQLGPTLFSLLRLLLTHRVRFHTHLIWLAKAIATVEETAHKLDPGFNMVEFSRPYAKSLLTQRLNPLRQPRELFFSLVDSLELLRDLPYDVSIILRQFKKGRVKIEFEHIGLEPIRQTLNSVSNRMALTVVLAALLISSSLIVLSGLPPTIFNIPVVGFAGFIISFFLAVALVFSILFGK